MNKKLKEAIFKQKARHLHRRAVRKVIKEENLYTTFVQPFTDIVDAAKLTGQDILSTMRLAFDLLFTLSPEKMQKALDRYDERAAKINEKWGPIMERNNEALANEDINLVSMVMAPEIFLASEALSRAYDAAGSMAEYLDQSGWKVPLASMALGYTPEESKDSTSKETEGKSLLGKLFGLFYVEAAWQKGDLILEQEKGESKKPKKEPDFKKAMMEYLKQTGILDKFKQDAEEMLNIQKEFIDTLMGEAVPRLELITALQEASDVDEFIGAIEEAEGKGLDLKAAGLDSVKAQVEESAKKLAQSDEFKEQAAQEGNTSVENLVPEDVEKAAMKVAFVNAKQNFDEQAEQGKKQLKDSAFKEIENQAPDEKNMGYLKKSPQGLKFIKIIEDAKQKIENA